MTSRHHLLADLENKRRKNEEEGVEVLSWDPVPESNAPGHDPYDNPGAGKTTSPAGGPPKRDWKKR